MNIAAVLAHAVRLHLIASSNRTACRHVARDSVPLAPGWVIPRSTFAALPWHARRLLFAWTHGRNSRSAVLVARSAARIHGMWVISLNDELVELSRPTGTAPAHSERASGVVYRRSMLDSSEITVVHGVRVTVPTRTAVEIARLHGFAEGLVACDWALRHGVATATDLFTEVTALGRVKGIQWARLAARFASGQSESPYESLLRALTIIVGAPNIREQVNFGRDRVDLLIDKSIVLEVDGAEKYEDGAYGKSTAQTIREEREREKRLHNAGLTVLRYGPRTIRTQPAVIIRDLEEALARRGLTATQPRWARDISGWPWG